MQSSSEGSEDDLDSMFPKADDPSTTTQNPQTPHIQNLQQFSELSPPASEGPTDSQILSQEPVDQPNASAAALMQDIIDTETDTNAPPQQQLSIAEKEPGASWNTRKQKEDEDRVKENLLDKGFSLKEFGDIYNAKDVSDEI